MLEILLIASGSFLSAMFCVWVYRLLKSAHDAKFRTYRLDGDRKSLNLENGAGVVEMGDSRLTMATASTTSRKPWGW